MSENNKLNEIIQTSLESIRSMIDSNTIIGNPITTANGTLIIPVSKVFVGFASGGLDYLGKKQENAASNNFGGGGGTGLTVSPVAFLIVAPSGNVELLNVNEPTGGLDPVSQIVGLLERSPDLIARVKSLFEKTPAEKESSAEVQDTKAEK